MILIVILFQFFSYSKLYCECFANGVHCVPNKCNCNSCFNNLENESRRLDAIEGTIERNPNAFRPKVVNFPKASDGDGSTRHHKVIIALPGELKNELK